MPLEMIISPTLHPIQALAISSQGLPRIMGCPLVGSLD